MVEIKEEIVMTVTYLVFCTRSPSQGGGEGEAVLLSRLHLELCDLLRPDTRTVNTNINTHAMILTKAAKLTDFNRLITEITRTARYASLAKPHPNRTRKRFIRVRLGCGLARLALRVAELNSSSEALKKERAYFEK